MRRLVLLLFLVTLATAAASHAGHPEHEEAAGSINVSSLLEDPESFASTYNSRADRMPSMVKSLVSGERINVHVEAGAGDRVIGLEMEGAKVDEVVVGGVEDPSVDLYTDREVLEGVASAENPADAAVDAFNGGGITYEAHGLGSQVKFAVISALSEVLGFFL